LRRAYREQSGVYVHGKTIYVAGTRDSSDVLTDISLLGTNLLMRSSSKYAHVAELLKTGEFNAAVGHSLGGIILHDLHNSNLGFTARLYNTPQTTFTYGSKRGVTFYNGLFDPLTLFNAGSRHNRASGHGI